MLRIVIFHTLVVFSASVEGDKPITLEMCITMMFIEQNTRIYDGLTKYGFISVL